MVLDDINKLLDTILKLINYYKESRHVLFNNFVEPVYSAFESVHSEYLGSFQNYRNKIKSSIEPLNSDNPILDTIWNDNLFTVNHRSKLIELSRYSSIRFREKGDVGYFVLLIRNYLVRTQNKDFRDSFEGFEYNEDQRFRYSLLDSLKRIFDSQYDQDFKRAEALRVLDSLVTEMQLNHAKVTREYYNLKEELLK